MGGVAGATVRADGKYTSLAPELNVSHVCRLWRRVAHSTPALWAVFLHDGSRTPRISLERLKQSISLSRNSPIEFGFKFLGFSEEGRRDEEEALRLILPEIHRCRALHIISNDDTGIAAFHDAVENIQAPMLESFTLSLDRCHEREDWESYDSVDITSWDTATFGRAPLTSLRMDGTGLSYMGPRLENIKDLRLEGPGNETSDPAIFWPSCIEQILTLPNLEVLSIANIECRDPYPKVADRPWVITAGSLKHFRYARHGGFDELTHYFLTSVSAPLLETLTLDDFLVFMCPVRYSPQDRFPSLHTLSLHNPSSLSFPIGERNDETISFQGFLSTTQHIKHLVISYAHSNYTKHVAGQPMYDGGPLFLSEIARYAESSPFWSNLETIALDVTSRDIATNLQRLVTAFPQARNILLPERHHATDAARNLVLPNTMKITVLGEKEPIIPAHPWSHWSNMEQDPFGRRPLVERMVSHPFFCTPRVFCLRLLMFAISICQGNVLSWRLRCLYLGHFLKTWVHEIRSIAFVLHKYLIGCTARRC